MDIKDVTLATRARCGQRLLSRPSTLRVLEINLASVFMDSAGFYAAFEQLRKKCDVSTPLPF